MPEMERTITANHVTATMPIKTACVTFDDIGYAGWQAELRLNVRARTYDAFLSQDRDEFWSAFTEIVCGWNFLSEDGEPLPLPRDGLGPRDLPIDLLNTLVLRYVEAMADSAAIPKARDAGSATTSRTNGVGPSSVAA
jgi:hypothetical protein